MDEELITIPQIVLSWGEWVPWAELLIDSRSGAGVNLPDSAGVYEVRHRDSEERLTIGKAANLRLRVKQGLVKGKNKHSSGIAIRATEDLTNLVIRWAITDRPAAVEEELHKRYRAKFGAWPQHTHHT